MLGRFLRNDVSLIDPQDIQYTKERFEDHIRTNLRSSIPGIFEQFKHQIVEKNNECKQIILGVGAIIERGRMTSMYSKESIFTEFIVLLDHSSINGTPDTVLTNGSAEK